MSKAAFWTVVSALVLGVFTSTGANASTSFDDVPAGLYYSVAVDWLVEQGITTGTTPTTFSPGAGVTRGQMAAFLWRFAGEPAANASTSFDDVPAGLYYSVAVDWLVEQGITTGTTPTTFSPGAGVTRGQMAAFLWRFAGEPAAKSQSLFGDVPAGLYYSVAVDWLVEQGITTGTTPTTFSPGAAVTRGQMAAFLWRFAGEPEVKPKPPVGGGDVVFTAAGDIGAGDRTDRVLSALAAEGADFHLVVGDLSYDEVTPESAWCGYVKGFMGSSYPFELLVGNHEDDDRVDGFIRNFTACLPDRMGSSGDYGVEYYFDTGPLRVIMVAADLSVDGEDYDYNTGSHRDWLLARIDEAEAAGRWTVVGTHKNCVTTGTKPCEIGEAMMGDMIAHGVDLVLQGHDHNYQRSHQLRCVDAGTTTAQCIVDTDSSFVAEAGMVVAITGWVGRSGNDVNTNDPEAGYFAVVAGPNTPNYSVGYLTVSVSGDTLAGEWTSVDDSGTDSFIIRR